MKRLNLSILIATMTMVSISGCSGGKLRNLLSRNDYQTLEEQNADQSSVAGNNKTQVVSAETEEDNSFFKLPRFLGGQDNESDIAPDPFITASEPTSSEEQVKAYQARVDERIAQEAQAAGTTLSDVEKQARDLFENGKDDGTDRFSAFAESDTATKDSLVKSDEKREFQNDETTNSFAEIFGQPDPKPRPEAASPLIVEASANPFETTSSPQPELSEFDKLLQAHERHATNTPPEVTIEPGMRTVENVFAEIDRTISEEPRAEDFFGNELASNAFENKAKASFDEIVNAGQDSATANDVWGQIDDATSSGDVFAAASQTDQQTAKTASAAPSNDVFGEDFQRTASRHGFTDTANPWGSLSTESEQPNALSVVESPSELGTQTPPLLTEFDPADHSDVNSDSFFPASQSQQAGSSATASAGQGMGLIIPASDTSESSAFFEFSEQPTAVQQISATQTDSGLTSVASSPLDNNADLFADATVGPAVQAAASSDSWSRRTWFLIIGCVLIAGLLFLPERQKR